MTPMAGESGDLLQLHAVVRGDVQGVGFRYFVVRVARQAGLEGWVRNRPDGAVECLAQGNRRALEDLLEALRRGPGSAEVQQVESDWRPPKDHLNGFQVVG
jgi:acylphosphatase